MDWYRGAVIELGRLKRATASRLGGRAEASGVDSRLYVGKAGRSKQESKAVHTKQPSLER